MKMNDNTEDGIDGRGQQWWVEWESGKGEKDNDVRKNKYFSSTSGHGPGWMERREDEAKLGDTFA